MREVKILIWLLVSGVVVSSMGQLLVLKDFLEAVHKEKPISTLLLMQRKVHKEDIRQELYPTSWPIICLDDTEMIELVYHFNSEFLALVYMESLEDILLLSALAANFNHMREARIVICLQFMSSKKFLDDIAHQAAEHKFLNLLVIEKSYNIFRFYPFPHPEFRVVDNPLEEKEIFPTLWRNFMGKSALTMPENVPPRSFLSTDPRTGRRRLNGFVFHTLKSFTDRHNITLKLLRPLNGNMSQGEIFERTLKGELDLPILGQFTISRHQNFSKKEGFLSITTVSIAVPCGLELSLFDRFFVVYGFQSTNIFLITYLLLSSADVVLRTLSDRVRRHRRRFEFLICVFNLRVLRCLMGMSIPLGNRVRSVRGQLTMAMSFSGLILTCIVAAQYSNLLTINPQYRYIMNFPELRDSKLTVVLNNQVYNLTKRFYPEILSKFFPNIWIMNSYDQLELIIALNTSYAYHTYQYKNDPFSQLQMHSTRKALCRTPKLRLFSDLTYSSVLPMNSIYGLALQEHCLQVWSSGLLAHWVDEAVRDIVSMSTVRNTRFARLPLVTDFKPLKLQDYKGCWHLLAIGFTLALCVFMAELLVGWRRGRTRNILI